jgi:hypothetical protein
MMNKLLRHCCLFLACFSPFVVAAQTPSDAIMMPKGVFCGAVLYGNESWDEYWEGTLKRANGNIGTFTRQSITPMFALGLSDKINVLAMLPWMSTKASQGQLQGVSGLQDLGLFLKVTALNKDMGAGKFTFHPSVGFTIPTSDYLEDYAPFSLGLGCPDLSLRGILQYKLNMGLYLRGTAAYQVRGTAKIERDFYYTDHAIYSDKVDMPNAWVYGVTLGTWMFGNSLKLELTFDGMNTIGGFDIRRQDAGFPANNMEFTRIGGGFHYYLPFNPSFSVIGNYGQVLTGRNVGQATTITAGLAYQFQLFGAEPVEMAPVVN